MTSPRDRELLLLALTDCIGELQHHQNYKILPAARACSRERMERGWRRGDKGGTMSQSAEGKNGKRKSGKTPEGETAGTELLKKKGGD